MEFSIQFDVHVIKFLLKGGVIYIQGHRLEFQITCKVT